MSSLTKLFQNVRLSYLSPFQSNLLRIPVQQPVVTRHRSWPPKKKPIIGIGKAYRRIVHFPEEYTVKPLDVTNLAGRDPETGRVVVKGIGGGIKHKYHWIKWFRGGPTSGPPQEERVIQIMVDGCRTAHIALVAFQDEIKYIIATENMKAGDIIKSSRCLTRIPVRPNEGDAYPLGSLPDGTVVSCIEQTPGLGGYYIHAAGSQATIIRRENNKVIVKMPTKQEYAFDPNCQATVGRNSNVMHNKTPIGSAQRNRWLGNRPRSGLWQRKSGRHGRKIKPIKKLKQVAPSPKKKEFYNLTLWIH